MFGFHFPENFRWPYVATSIQEFWRRWHLSLSTWFRDYLYIPLGGNRVSRARQYRNLVIVFFLCGLWHGASWNFVIWGLWHGAFLVAERLVGVGVRLRNPQPPAADPQSGIRSDRGVLAWPIWPHLYTTVVVMIGWVFFRSDTLLGAVAFLKAMAGVTTAAATPYTVRYYLTPELWLALAAGGVGSTPWLSPLRLRIRSAAAAELFANAALAAVLVASVMQMAARTYNPFIYFRF